MYTKTEKGTYLFRCYAPVGEWQRKVRHSENAERSSVFISFRNSELFSIKPLEYLEVSEIRVHTHTHTHTHIATRVKIQNTI